MAAFAYDRFNISKSKLLQGFNLTLKIGKAELLLTSTNMFSGLLMVFLGAFFIINSGTTAITGADLLGMIALLAVVFASVFIIHRFVITKLASSHNTRKIMAIAEILIGLAVFGIITKHREVRTTGLAEQLSNAVLENTKQFNVVAGVIFVIFVALLFYFVRKQLKGRRK